MHKYITGTVDHYGHKMLFINSVPDHLHMFIGLNPKQSISDLMSYVKVIALNLSIKDNLQNENLIGRRVMEHLVTVTRR